MAKRKEQVLLMKDDPGVREFKRKMRLKEKRREEVVTSDKESV